ncbi:MAG TPA: hypothetical protein VNI52_12695 [Sphingobacteriaceae bacterium]|nr:hypothetical protein [Sphingobacteriaceae bacterium]
MKTSIKLLITAVAILFGTTAAYDFALQTSYEKGTHRDPWYNFSQLNYKDFDEIDIQAANLVNVSIVRSDTFDVRLNNNLSKEVKIKQEGSRLIITFDTKRNRYRDYAKSLQIKCPIIRRLNTDAVFILDGKSVTIKNGASENFYGSLGVSLAGFNQDTLALTMHNASKINLINNSLRYLNVNMGMDKASEPVLKLNKTNKVKSAKLNIQNKSMLNLNDIAIGNLEYKISDSAQVNLSGVSLKLIKSQ